VPQQLSPSKVTIAQAVRDVVIHAMDKGQLLPLFVAVIIISVVWRLPEESLTELATQVWQNLLSVYLLGWVLCIAAVCGWASHYRWIAARHANEIDRISNERNSVQQKLAGPHFIKSSNEADQQNPKQKKKSAKTTT